MSSTTTGNERILSQNTRVKSAGQNKKERPFIKTTAEKKIADDEFMAAAIGDVEWLRQSIRGNRGVINYDKNVSIFHGSNTGYYHIFQFKAHLNYIKDLGPSIQVWARTQSKKVNWCFCVYTDPSPSRRFLSQTSVSELVATCSDFLRRGRPRLWNAHAQSSLFTWSLPNLVQNDHGLGWPRIRASDVV